MGLGESPHPGEPAGTEWPHALFQPRLVLAVLLLAAYAIPVFIPPHGMPPAPLAPDAPLMERLFPGVPGGWVAIRLLCLVGAALCAVSLPLGNPFPNSAGEHRVGADGAIARPLLWVALGLAVLQMISTLWVSRFGRTEQLVYVASFALAPLVLASGRQASRVRRKRDWRPVTVVAIVVAAWLLLRLPAAWRSPRAADVLDTWIGLQQLRLAADPSFNLVTGRFRSGGGSLYMLLQGAGVAQLFGIQPSFALAQAAQFVWLGVSGLVVGLLMGRLLGSAAAAVSTAAFLFSPFTQMTLLTPVALFFGPLMTVGLLALLVKVHDERSLPSFAALGGLAGIAATQPSVAPVAISVFCAAAWWAWRRARFPKLAVMIATVLCVSGGLTAVPNRQAIQSMVLAYTRGRAQWVGHEMAGFGQISAARSEYTVEAALSRPADTPLGALLAAFALPRTPLRSLGDVLFDPLSSGLSAIGIAVCLRAVGASWLARLLLGALALALVPGCVASADRISVLRLIAAPVPMAMLAGVGWESMRRWFGALRSTAVTGVTTAAIVLAGISIFDYVNPAILQSSWVSLTLQALASQPPLIGGAVVLDHPDPHSFPYWYLNEIMENLPRQPVAVRVYDSVGGVRSGLGGDHDAGAELFFWSPGLEEDQHVSRAMCQEWPGAALYTLVDSAGRSRVFAARPAGPAWKPPLSAVRWRVQGCGATLATEATWAAAVLRHARALVAHGRRPEARAALRAAARRNFCQADLFDAAAEALLGSPASAEEVREAVHWARRACQVTRFRDPTALSTLAAAHAAAGQSRDAVETARTARGLAADEGNEALVVQLDKRVQEYETAAQLR